MLTIEQIKSANRAAGLHFFDPDAARFFRSRAHARVYSGQGGTFFVTGEATQFGPRRYTVREFHSDGRIETAGAFSALSRKEAHALAARWARKSAA